MRLFFAIWPDKPLRTRLAALLAELKPTQHARWIDPARLHMTLAFLGEVAPEGMEALEAIGGGLGTPCGSFVLDRLELWRGPGVLCLVPSEEPAPLIGLADELARRLRKADFPVEKRAFRPHLTLARRAVTCPARDLPPLRWQPDALTLVESTQEGGKSCYRVLRSWPVA